MKRALAWLPLVLLLAGCNMPFGTREHAAVPPPALNGSTYRMVAHDGHQLATDTRYLLSFTGDRLGGKVCNQFGGHYSLDGTQLQVHQLVSTRMFCVDKAQMAVESALFAALEKGVTMQRQTHRMQLFDATGKLLFSYQLFMD